MIGKEPKTQKLRLGEKEGEKKRDFFALISREVLRSEGGYKCHREGLKGFLFRYQDYFIFSPTPRRARFPGFPG